MYSTMRKCSRFIQESTKESGHYAVIAMIILPIILCLIVKSVMLMLIKERITPMHNVTAVIQEEPEDKIY
jgi:hypothetical protein